MRPPSQPWLHPALVVGTSPIQGRGLFAIEPVSSGTTVVRFGGSLVTERELAEVFATATGYVDTLSIDQDLHLVLPPGTPVGLGNHSCDPSLWWGGDFVLTTRRPLAAGDEATVDYGTITDAADFSLVCLCGTSGCRGRVTGQDWRRDELRHRYHRHWVPALLRHIDQLASAETG